MTSLSVLAYKIYNTHIYPRFHHLRGFTRLISYFRRLAELKTDHIDISKAEGINRERWDHLIVLDACRYDLYQEVVGEGDKIVSLSASSSEFVEKNFSNQKFEDVVYITACHYFDTEKFKSWTGNEPKEVFHEVIHLYQTDWDNESDTVLPKDVLEASKDAIREFPEKRLIVHFMQPHAPFVNYSFDMELPDTVSNDNDSPNKVNNIWELGEVGSLDKKEIEAGYKSNLEYVWPYVENLLELLDGKKVVTSDHGNLIGEGGLYGHIYGSKSKKVREVPWHIID